MYSIGTDLVDMDRIPLKAAFIKRILTPEEQAEYEALSSDRRRREYLAGRFAAKEAIYKATQDIHYLSYAVLHEENGKPYVKGHPDLAVSIAHDGHMAIAFVIYFV